MIVNVVYRVVANNPTPSTRTMAVPIKFFYNMPRQPASHAVDLCHCMRTDERNSCPVAGATGSNRLHQQRQVTAIVLAGGTAKS